MTRITGVSRFRGVRRDREAHLISPEEFSGVQNIESAEGVLAKRPGLLLADWHIEPATYWPLAVFEIDLPAVQADVPDNPDTEGAPLVSNGSYWGAVDPDNPQLPGAGDDSTPHFIPPLRRPGDGDETQKLRLVVTLPEKITEGQAFNLTVTAERYWENGWGWVVDTDFTGRGCDWKAYVSGNGSNLLRQKNHLKLADGSTFYLDPQYMPPGAPQWNDGVWTGSVKLLDAGDQLVFKFVAEYKYRDKGGAAAAVLYAPSQLVIEFSEDVDDDCRIRVNDVAVVDEQWNAGWYDGETFVSSNIGPPFSWPPDYAPRKVTVTSGIAAGDEIKIDIFDGWGSQYSLAPWTAVVTYDNGATWECSGGQSLQADSHDVLPRPIPDYYFCSSDDYAGGGPHVFDYYENGQFTIPASDEV